MKKTTVRSNFCSGAFCLVIAFGVTPAAHSTTVMDSSPALETFLNPDETPLSKYALLGPALSYHLRPKEKTRSFNERHLAIGVERRTPFVSAPDWETRWSASIVKDSFNSPSFFASTAVARKLFVVSDFEVRSGLVAGVAYKSLNWDSPLKLVPLLGPAIYLNHKPSGLGLSFFFQAIPAKNARQTKGVFVLQTSFQL